MRNAPEKATTKAAVQIPVIVTTAPATMKRPRSMATDDIALGHRHSGAKQSHSRRFTEYQPDEPKLSNRFRYEAQAQSAPERDLLRFAEQS